MTRDPGYRPASHHGNQSKNRRQSLLLWCANVQPDSENAFRSRLLTSTACRVIDVIARAWLAGGGERPSFLPHCTNRFSFTRTRGTMSERDLMVPFVFPFDTVERVPPCPCALHCAISPLFWVMTTRQQVAPWLNIPLYRTVQPSSSHNPLPRHVVYTATIYQLSDCKYRFPLFLERPLEISPTF